MSSAVFQCSKCELEIDKEYQYCPRCGRLAARLVAVPNEGAADGFVRLAPDQNRFRLTLRNEGPAAVTYEVESKGYLAVVESGSGRLAGFKTAGLELEVVPDAPKEFTAEVHIRSNDGDRRHWWEPKVERTELLTLTIRRLGGPKVTSCASVLLLPELDNWQAFIVHNEGDLPGEAHLEVPSGYSIAVGRVLPEDAEGSRSASVKLDPGEWERVWVRQDDWSVGDRGHVRGLDRPIEMRLLRAKRGGFKPKLIVGIDFGTVNTSVLIREPSLDKEEWIFGKERFPSLLYVPFDPKEKPAIGEDAERFFGRDTGVIVDGIKTLVRRDAEDYYGFGVGDLLRMYLGALRDAIGECFRLNRWDDQGDVLYVFTLPVLDAGERYRKQLERMRKAAVEVGFPDDDEVLWFLEEPVAAALFCLRHSDDVFGGNPPEEFAVLDAGGGTTDVCVGRVAVDQRGKWRFEPDKTFSLYPDASAAAEFYHGLIYRGAVLHEDQLGGRLLDYEIAHSLEGRNGTPARLCRKPWLKLYRGEASRRVEVAVREYILGLSKVKEDICNNYPQVTEVDLAEAKVGPSPRGFRGYFFDHYPDERVLLTEALIGELAPTGRAVVTYHGDIAEKVRALWQEPGVGPEFNERLSSYSQQLKIVAVGGATAIPEFRECIKLFTQRDCIDTGAYRQLAVVKGAVLAYDAFAEKVLRYPVRLKITNPEGGTSCHQILGAYQSLSAPTSFRRQYDLAPGDQVKAELQVLMSEEWVAVSSATYRAPRQGPVTLSASYDNDGVLRAAWLISGSKEALPFWEVRV